jgi:hypothetical protein
VFEKYYNTGESFEDYFGDFTSGDLNKIFRLDV